MSEPWWKERQDETGQLVSRSGSYSLDDIARDLLADTCGPEAAASARITIAGGAAGLRMTVLLPDGRSCTTLPSLVPVAVLTDLERALGELR
jgi:hypothetical protein